MKKTWEKGRELNKEVERFTVGNDRSLDLRLAEWDIIGTAAHVIMLNKTGLLAKEELKSILKLLSKLFEESKAGMLKINEGVEDIHSQIEIILTNELGKTGEKVHTGRSRNDQVLTDVRLFMRYELSQLAQKVSSIALLLLKKAEEHKSVLMPGYTHSMTAMISSYGMWFASWAESLADDLLVNGSAIAMNNRSPLGSAAGYGSSLPVDRDLTCSLLEFQDINIISSYCQFSRIKSDLSSLNAISSIALSLNKMSSEIILYSGENYGFFELAEEITTGSSIMPQKKNPDVLETVRSKCNRLLSRQNEVIIMFSNLGTGYHRDMQLLKDIIICSVDEINDCLMILDIALSSISINQRIFENPIYRSLLSTNEVNALVKNGMPFREAYRKIAKSLSVEDYKLPSIDEYSHQGSIGNLCTDRIRKRLNDLMEKSKAPDSTQLAEKLFSKNC